MESRAKTKGRGQGSHAQPSLLSASGRQQNEALTIAEGLMAEEVAEFLTASGKGGQGHLSGGQIQAPREEGWTDNSHLNSDTETRRHCPETGNSEKNTLASKNALQPLDSREAISMCGCPPDG